MTIQETVAAKRAFFETGATKNPEFRATALHTLLLWVTQHEADICQALRQDLSKSDTEGYMTEIGMVRQELHYQLRHLFAFTRPKRVPTPLNQWPAKSKIIRDPYGVVLIMSPWNYPFQLTVVPLIDAIAGGNCALLKPSAMAPATSALIAQMASDCFAPDFISVVEGGRDANTALLAQPFDYVFFTGSKQVGQTVMEACAKNLTPMTLELGGKCPCIVDATADPELAARRIVFGKGINAGQTCVAPDYLLVHRSVKELLIQYICQYTRLMYSDDPCSNPDWPKIINEKHFDRLLALIAGQSVILGGEYKAAERKIAPTLLDNVSFEDPCMQEEIFGPILPIITFDSLNEAIARVSQRPRPLALYLFTADKSVQHKIVETLSFGGGCINDTVMHLANHHLPFGGVGASGMGAYHGKAGFDTFTRPKSILVKSRHVDITLRYPPFGAKSYHTIRRFFH